ncbi:MAG: undecaprenyl-diphosphate phosphatase [Spirochaetaceae bacterium]|jgi:undecaprenyl-diphosphatase|nr:undecaprenyl-diphosphate phosphatase [Spirochaetaceae bacterium]
MDIFEAVVLGAVQGLTEFLPVSSSGHLVLFQKIIGVDEPTLLFDTLLHCGTLAAIFLVLRRDIWALLRNPLQPLSLYLIIGTVPAVIAGLFLKDFIEQAFAGGAFLGYAFIFTSAALFGAEYLSALPGRERRSGDISWFDALVIGVLQAVAIMPAVSRSGLTLSGALARRLERGLAARFSFLLAIPAILGALVLQIHDLAAGEGGAPSIGTLPVIAGTLTAALVGIVSVSLMLKLVREHSLKGFGIYTAVLGVLVLVDQHLSHIFF